MAFKKDFVWGVATASYQIEGGYNADGKLLSVWDDFSHKQGNIEDNQTGDIACDHYNRYYEDILLMKKLGVKAYRFSISMSRILDENYLVNEKGVEFYNKIINLLLSFKITPYVTLYHWDLPLHIQEKGGFLNREVITNFLSIYTNVVCKYFGDRVKHFITFNEPFSFISNGHVYGRHAPGLKLSKKQTLEVIHNMLVCHGTMAKIIRESVTGVSVGITTSSWVACPETESDYDISYNDFFALNEESPSECVSIYTDPIYFGKYPDGYYEVFKDILPNILDGDFSLISQPNDFIGHNIYTGYHIGKNGKNLNLPNKLGNAVSDVGWEFMPEALYYGVKYLYQRYKLPIYITENGVSMMAIVNDKGKVLDNTRIDYMSSYLKALKKATEEGVDILGYFYWSFCDNFEWACGYKPRFGLVYIDYITQKRMPKQSYYWYKKVIKQNGKKL